MQAQEISRKTGCMMMGASHADGSYRNCGISIPIAYVIDKNGGILFAAKDDTRTFILDTDPSDCYQISK